MRESGWGSVPGRDTRPEAQRQSGAARPKDTEQFFLILREMAYCEGIVIGRTVFISLTLQAELEF